MMYLQELCIVINRNGRPILESETFLMFELPVFLFIALTKSRCF